MKISRFQIFLIVLGGFTALTAIGRLVVLPAFVAARPVSAQPLLLLGTRPAQLKSDPTVPVPNQQAITLALWAPGIDEGYVPQGLTYAEGQILISAYHSTNPLVSMGPCRVYRLDPESGFSTGYFDLPPSCGHAGGLAYAGDGLLLLSDTDMLYRIDLQRALSERKADKAITGTLKLTGALRGSFAAFAPAGTLHGEKAPDGPFIFIGTWTTSNTGSSGYFIPLSLFDSHNGTRISESDAARSIHIDTRAQGGAFAPDGSLWISYSNLNFGKIVQLDAVTGRRLGEYEMVPGTEDVGFDTEGRLWAVSEAGSLRWRRWRISFPVVFRLDPSLLDDTSSPSYPKNIGD